MSINDTISDLLHKRNVRELTFTLSESGDTVLVARQAMALDNTGNALDAGHRIVAASPAECLAQLTARTDHLNDLQSRIVQIKKGSN